MREMERYVVVTGEDPDIEFKYWVSVTGGSIFHLGSKNRYYRNIHAWVEDTFGAKKPNTWSAERWFATDEKYYFKYEADRTLFVLRWENQLD